MNKILGVGLLCLAMSANASSIFKWVDKNGQVHYEDRRPGSGIHSQYLGEGGGSNDDRYEAYQQMLNEKRNNDLVRRYDQSIREHQAAKDWSYTREYTPAERNRLEQINRDITYYGVDSHFGTPLSREGTVKRLDHERRDIVEKKILDNQ